MTPDRIRIEMALLEGLPTVHQGFKYGSPDPFKTVTGTCAGWPTVESADQERQNLIRLGYHCGPLYTHPAKLPDYLTDRNAVAKAFAALSADIRAEVCVNLLDSLDYDHVSMSSQTEAVMLATPAQWCEAILRAAGKWHESRE